MGDAPAVLLPGAPATQTPAPSRATIEDILVYSTPEPTPRPVYVAIDELWDLCATYEDWGVETCYWVAYCEMGGYWNPNALGRAGERGPFQIHPIHEHRFDAHGWDFLVDAHVPARAVVIAHEIWEDSGWWPWTCARI